MLHFLDIPWGQRPGGFFDQSCLRYFKQYKAWVYEGDVLPEALRKYRPQDFSYLRFLQDQQNGFMTPIQSPAAVFTPRPHQVEAAKKILAAYEMGQRGFLSCDKTGVGKTLSNLSAVTAIAKTTGHTPKKKAKLLVVAPKAVLPTWRQTIRSYPYATQVLEPLLINYQQLNKLILEPESAKSAKRARTKNRRQAKQGKPRWKFDFVIFDESHYLKNYPSSTMSVAAVNIAGLEDVYVRGKSPFVIFATATPGATPLNFAVMAGVVAPLMAPGQSATPSRWGDFLAQQGFAVSRGKTGQWTWATVPWFGKNSDDPAERKRYQQLQKKAVEMQRRDALRIGKALMKPEAPFLSRSPSDIAGWPEQQIIPFPVELDAVGRDIYEELWSRFRNWLKMTPAKSDPKGALVENLRYRQKSSLLKVPALVDAIVDWVDQGEQVYVSLEFIETLEMFKKELLARKIPVCEISGRNGQTDTQGRSVPERESERLRFQTGAAKVCLCTVVAGISLHAGETLPNGQSATKNSRVTVILDVRQNSLDTSQALGRCHRSGMNSRAYFPFLADTIDEKVITQYTNKIANMDTMINSNDPEMLNNLFRGVLQ